MNTKGRNRQRWTLGPVLLFCAAACGGDGAPTGPSVDDTPPPEAGVERVIASNVFTVEATDSVAGFTRVSSSGTVAIDVGPTVGKVLVLSLRDVSRPDLICTGGTFESSCAVLEVLNDTEEGFVGLEFNSGRQNFYLQSTSRLDLLPEPG